MTVFAGLLVAACLVVSGCGDEEPVDAAATQAFANKIAQGLAGRDKDALRMLVCSGATAQTASLIEAAEEVDRVRLVQMDRARASTVHTRTIKDQECPGNHGVAGQEPVELAEAGRRVRLRLDPSEITPDDHFTGADLTGTVDGKQINAGRISVFREDAGWCVYTFYVL